MKPGSPTGESELVPALGFAFFLATGIFFFGNNHVLPEFLLAPALLALLVRAVVVWTLPYVYRVRLAAPGVDTGQAPGERALTC